MPLMLYSEPVLLQLLEGGALSFPDALHAIAGALGLEFFRDPAQSLLSLGAESFVLDVVVSDACPPVCTLILVDEELMPRLLHVQHYLSAHMNNLPVLYHLLRFFVHLSAGNASLGAGIATGTASFRNFEVSEHYSNTRCCCQCVFTGEYCISSDLKTLEENYNIFTHRKDFVISDPFVVVERKALESASSDVNLAAYLTPRQVSLQVLEKLIAHFKVPAGCFEYKGTDVAILGQSVYVRKESDLNCVSESEKSNELHISPLERNLTIPAGFIRCPVASFALKRGCCLSDAVKLSSILQNHRNTR